MQSRIWCAAAVALWVIGAAIVGWVFVKGWTIPGADGRTEIRLAPSERDQVLKEMRQLLQAVHGVVAGLNAPAPDAKQVEQTARAVGMQRCAGRSREQSWNSGKIDLGYKDRENRLCGHLS